MDNKPNPYESPPTAFEPGVAERVSVKENSPIHLFALVAFLAPVAGSQLVLLQVLCGVQTVWLWPAVFVIAVVPLFAVWLWVRVDRTLAAFAIICISPTAFALVIVLYSILLPMFAKYG